MLFTHGFLIHAICVKFFTAKDGTIELNEKKRRKKEEKKVRHV